MENKENIKNRFPEPYVFSDGETLFPEHLNDIWNGITKNKEAIEEILNNLPDPSKPVLDLSNAEIALKTLFGYKGALSIDKILKLSAAKFGDIYIIGEDDLDTINVTTLSEFEMNTHTVLKVGDILFCIESFSSPRNINSFYKYWIKRNNLLVEASEGNPGLVSAKFQNISGKKNFLDGVDINSILNINSDTKVYKHSKDSTGKVTAEEVLLLPTSFKENLKKELLKLNEVNESLREALYQKIQETKNYLLAEDAKINSQFSKVNNVILEQIKKADELTKQITDTENRLSFDQRDFEVNMNLQYQKDNEELNTKFENFKKESDAAVKEALADCQDIANNLQGKLDDVNLEFKNFDIWRKDTSAEIIHMTPEEFENLSKNDNKFYVIDDEKGKPLFFYIGNFCIAKKGDKPTYPEGFPYIFPIIF